MKEEKEIEEQPLIFEAEPSKSGFLSKLWKGIKILLIIAALLSFVIYLPLFRLEEIRIKGSAYINENDVCHISGICKGQHILSIKPEKITESLLKDLRIEEAKVERIFPNGLEIKIKERTPVACVACEYGFLDIDGNGIVLDAYRTPKGRTGVVTVSGVKLTDLYVGDKVKEDSFRGMMLFLRSINEEQRTQLKELVMNDFSHILLRTVGGVEIRIGKPERFSEKARQTENFLIEFSTSGNQVEYVDFEYKSPFIKFKNNVANIKR